MALGKRGWMKVMPMANSIPDTCQETTRGHREELQQEAIPASPAWPQGIRGGQDASPAAPAVLHIPQPARQEKPQHQPRRDCQAGSVNHLLKPGVWRLFFLFKIITLCLSQFFLSKIDTAAHSKPPPGVSDGRASCKGHLESTGK